MAFDISISGSAFVGDVLSAEVASQPEGLSISFSAEPLDSNPPWTRLDNQVANGLSVNHISIRRGRPTERDKTGVGTMTVSIIDTAGRLDPTNPTSPYIDGLDPIKQIAYALQNPVTLEWGTLFRGFVDDWNHDITGLDKTGKFDNIDIECSDALAIIADAEIIPDTAGNVVPTESTGDVFYEGVTITKDRILAAIRDVATTFNPFNRDWPPDQLEIFTGNVMVRGIVYGSKTSLLQVIDDAADAEFPGVANRWVDKNGKITFHGRFARFNPTDPQYHINFWRAGDAPAFALDNTVAVLSDLSFTRGKANLINSSQITPTNIKDDDIAGQTVTNPASIQAFGARSISYENLLTDGHSDGTTTPLQETKQFSQYYVDNYANPRTRISQVSFRLQPPTSPYGPTTWALLCGIDISDVIHVKTTHPGGGGFDEDFYVEGMAYDIVPMTEAFPEVTLTLDLSPKAYYDTEVVGSQLDVIDRILGTGSIDSIFVGISTVNTTVRSRTTNPITP